MGLFGDIFKGIGKVATSLIPGPVDDIIFEGATSLFGGSGSKVGVQQRAAQARRVATQPITRQQRPRLPDIDFGGGITVNPPFGGSPGIGVTTRSRLGPAQQARPSPSRARAGMAMPMIGQIAVEPETKNVQVRDCPTGMVLAIDGLCYPKQMVPKKWRMWKPDPRPVVSRADQKAIQRADRAKKRLVNLTKKAGAHASLTKPRRRK